MAKLLIAQPQICNPSLPKQTAPHRPLDLQHLASHVRQNGHTVSVWDAIFDQEPATFAHQLSQESPDVIAISTTPATREMAIKLADIAWDANKPVIMMGPDAADDPLTYLSQPEVDIVVHHGGHQTMLALLTLMDSGRMLNPIFLKHEPGIAYRDSYGGPMINPPHGTSE